MRFNLWQSVKISMTIVGTTIGAGFASGREIWEFFGSYGEGSNGSILLAMLLFFAASVVILLISWEKKTSHYSEVLDVVIGPKLAKIFDVLVLFFLLTSTLVMVAGSGATFQQWSGSFQAGVLAMVVAVMLILFFDIKGLMSMNVILIPVMTSVLLFVCFHFLQISGWTASWSEPEVSPLPVWPSAVTYAAFNILSLLAVLSTMGGQIRHAAEIWVAGGISSLCLGLVAYMYNYSLLRVKDLISQYEIPLFALVRDYSPVWIFAISMILWMAIYTTAASNIHGLAFRLSDRFRLPRWAVGGAVMILLIPLTKWGFATLVTVLYPLYGVLNLFILTMLLLYPFSSRGEKAR
ncbi:YkvI family membrane protein [Salinithrix halophila]|uniref:Membrane protein YkvI n=1 Tax=Salinithrix halophila TaxID=1485204 RepID=A0ABV8JHJ8_9BACL